MMMMMMMQLYKLSSILVAQKYKLQLIITQQGELEWSGEGVLKNTNTQRYKRREIFSQQKYRPAG